MTDQSTSPLSRALASAKNPVDGLPDEAKRSQVPFRVCDKKNLFCEYHLPPFLSSCFVLFFCLVSLLMLLIAFRFDSFCLWQEAFGSFALLLMVFPFNSFLGDTWSAWIQHFFSVMIVRPGQKKAIDTIFLPFVA